MNKEIKEKWIKALRSGEYQQGKGFLSKKENDGRKYCCLGVLCDLAVKEGVIPEPNIYYNQSYLYDTYNGMLPESVCNWAGITRSGIYEVGEPDLVRHNDSGETFEEIANIIEEKF